MLAPWTPLFWSLALLLCLWWVSRRLAYYMLSTFYLLTRSQAITASAYAIFILPGTLVHELSHWLVAQALGVRTGRFSILPSPGRKGALRLGSVDVRGGNLWQHTLIGLAPLLFGSLLTVVLSYSLVDVAALSQAWLNQQWRSIFGLLGASLRQPDALVWIYLLFTVSDAMFLSASDRAPVQRMLLYLGAVLALLYVLGLAPSLPSTWAPAIHDGFLVFAYGLAVALILHLALLLIFTTAYFSLRPLLAPRG